MTREEAIDIIENKIQIDVRFCTEKEVDQYWEALYMALAALRGPTREMVGRMRGYWMHKKVQSNNSMTGYFNLPECECSDCGCIVPQQANFCPHCGEPKTDEAVDIMVKRLEATRSGKERLP